MTKMKRQPRVGDWVEVRSKEEILATLDGEGQLDGMPFMPEMLGFCGQRFRVYKSAHKTCDTVFPVRGLRLHDMVHLETRCGGQAHGGCQAGCLIFWKTAWLKAVDANSAGESVDRRNPAGISESTLRSKTQIAVPDDGTLTFVCQATRLPYAGTELPWWEIRQYVEDYQSGNVSLRQLIDGGVYWLSYALSQAGIGLGRPIRWLYDQFYPLWGGTPFPQRSGRIPLGQGTPTATLNLQPGELVRVKSHAQILETIDTRNRNRGLFWDAEEVPYCGGVYRVLRRVTKIVNEKTGKMLEMKNPCIVLDSVVCQSRFSACRMFCPRSIHSYWREVWLERVDAGPAAAPASREGENVPLMQIETSSTGAKAVIDQ